MSEASPSTHQHGLGRATPARGRLHAHDQHRPGPFRSPTARDRLAPARPPLALRHRLPRRRLYDGGRDRGHRSAAACAPQQARPPHRRRRHLVGLRRAGSPAYGWRRAGRLHVHLGHTRPTGTPSHATTPCCTARSICSTWAMAKPRPLWEPTKAAAWAGAAPLIDRSSCLTLRFTTHQMVVSDCESGRGRV